MHFIRVIKSAGYYGYSKSNNAVDVENTDGMVKEFKDLPQDFKNKFIIKGE